MKSRSPVCHLISVKSPEGDRAHCHLIGVKDWPGGPAWLAGALLLGAVFAAYLPALSGEFLWDDDLHVTANPTIIGPLGLKEIWTTAAANYFPLVLTNFWVQHALWGLQPFGYHAVTLAFHALAGVLLWRVLVRLRVPGAWLGAALWALHPVQVESVAWICELKNTQSAVFFLLAIWFWLKWLDVGRGSDPPSGHPAAPGSAGEAGVGRGLSPTPGGSTRLSGIKPDLPATFSLSYALAFVCTLLAILSKPSTVMLPVVFALCWWWQRGRLRWRDFLWLAPFFALSAAAAGWTIWEQRIHSGAIGPEWNQTWPERGIIAGRVIWFYLGKLAWPHPLIFIYPRWEIDAAQPLAYLPLAAASAGLFLLWHWRHGPGRAAFLAAAFFAALLFPVLGFFDVFFFRYSFVGDHFQYLASMGPLALAAAGVAVGWDRLATRACPKNTHDPAFSEGGALSPSGPETLLGQRPPRGSGGADQAAPSAPGFRISSSIAFLRPAAAAAVLLSLGALTWRQCGVYANRESLWRSTLADNPRAAMAWLNLGDTLAKQNRHDEAIACFTRAADIKPDDADAYNDLGCEMVIAGYPATAVPVLERALRLQPASAEAHNNLGNALRDLGRIPEAIAHYEQALRLKPDYGEAHNNLGCELAEGGRPTEAVPHFEAALRLNPRHAEAHDNFGNALRNLGRLDAAISHYEQALQLKPDFPEAHHNFGLALVQAGRVAEAIAHFEAAVRLAPKIARMRINLGTALATTQRWPEAIAQFAAAVEIAPDHFEVRLKLALTLASTGRLAESVPHFEHALRLQPASADLHQDFGEVLRVLGRKREALAQFEEAARLREPAPRKSTP